MEEGREGSGCRYTLPGILHFLQHEWSRFELERAQWEAEKAELQARIAFLQGERRGQENLKRDLIRNAGLRTRPAHRGKRLKRLYFQISLFIA